MMGKNGKAVSALRHVKLHSRNGCGIILSLWVFTKPTRACLPRPVPARMLFERSIAFKEIAESLLDQRVDPESEIASP
jgi:hypothetical protein